MAYINLKLSGKDSTVAQFATYLDTVGIDLLYGTSAEFGSGGAMRSANPIPIPTSGTNSSWLKLLTFKRDPAYPTVNISELKMWCDQANSSNSTDIILYAYTHTGSAVQAPAMVVGQGYTLSEGSILASAGRAQDFYSKYTNSNWTQSYVFCTGGVNWPDYDTNIIVDGAKTVGVFQLAVGPGATAGNTWSLAMIYQFKVT